MSPVSPIPLSDLGRLTGRFHLGETRPLIAMNCYFDGSIGGRSDEWLGFGGLIATDATWAKFQKDWVLMLKNRDPIAPYLHISDLLTGNGPFKTKAGWNEEKAQQLVWDAASLLAVMDQKRVCGFACAIDVRAHKRLLAEGYVIPKPAVICAENGLGWPLDWYMDKYGFELAHLFYDQGESFIKSIRYSWLKEERRKSKIKEGFWAMVANVQPLNMRDTPSIQAADMLAWSFIRRIRNEPGDKWANLATVLIGDRATGPGALTATQLDPIDEETMRRKYSKQN